MTNFEKIKDGLSGLIKEVNAEYFAYLLGGGISSFDCIDCKISDKCNHMMYQLDENGEIITDSDGDYVFKDDAPNCEKVILAWLNEEAT